MTSPVSLIKMLISDMMLGAYLFGVEFSKVIVTGGLEVICLGCTSYVVDENVATRAKTGGNMLLTTIRAQVVCLASKRGFM